MSARIAFRRYDDVSTDAAILVAESAGVCVRPHVRTVTDQLTGDTIAVPIACGSTRESVCKACAVKARRLRMHQCREGWHRTDADHPTAQELDDLVDVDDDQAQDGDELLDDQTDDVPAGSGRRVRSTRRLPGLPDLPMVPMEDRTVGREFVDERTGRVFRPSMFLTLTLPSYGKVREGTGVPVRTEAYDYRRAALDALLFPRLLDRFWQNLRRCAGYKVQYFSAIEAQRRLAPHVHAALRGAIPRAVLKAVVAATYHAAWWPPLDHVAYAGDQVPVWDRDTGRYVDPDTGVPLATWDEATRDLEQPAHVVCFGKQVDIKGLLGGTPDSDRAVRYLCKYLTKNVADTHTGQHSKVQAAVAYEAHIDRLHTEVQ